MPDDITPAVAAPQIDLKDPAITAAIAAAVEKATVGLKANRDDLIKEKQVLADKYQGIDVEKVKALLSQAQTDEELKLFKEGGIDEVVDQRTAKMRQQHTAEKDVLSKELMDSTNVVDRLQKQINYDKISALISTAYLASSGDPASVKFIIREAMDTYSFDKKGSLQALDSTGETLFSADGKSVLSPTEYIQGLQKEFPTFWPQSQSAGLNGNIGSIENLDSLAGRDHNAFRAMREKQTKNQ